MSSAKYLKVLHEVVNLPTAPFAEQHVIAYIRRFVARRPGLSMRADRFGNLLVRYRPGGKEKRGGRPILLAAHTDHPGFVAEGMVDRRRVRAEFRGWVSASYFAGERLRFFHAGRWIRGRIVEVLQDAPRSRDAKLARASADSFRDQNPPKGVIADLSEPVTGGAIGMWDFPDAVVRGSLLHARGCDDTAGLAAVLCALEEACRRKSPGPCLAFFTRAEEVGFGGALAALDAGTVPKEAIVIAVETSKAVAGVSLGDGPVLRVGDKASVFTPAATAYCQSVAEALGRRDKSFRFQRKLMDGGTCESTAYCHYGLDATGLCLPLGNYHNMDESRGRIGAEYIDTRDFLNLVKWFTALTASRATRRFEDKDPGLGNRLDALLREHRGKLLATAGTVLG